MSYHADYQPRRERSVDTNIIVRVSAHRELSRYERDQLELAARFAVVAKLNALLAVECRPEGDGMDAVLRAAEEAA